MYLYNTEYKFVLVKNKNYQFICTKQQHMHYRKWLETSNQYEFLMDVLDWFYESKFSIIYFSHDNFALSYCNSNFMLWRDWLWVTGRETLKQLVCMKPHYVGILKPLCIYLSFSLNRVLKPIKNLIKFIIWVSSDSIKPNSSGLVLEAMVCGQCFFSCPQNL